MWDLPLMYSLTSAEERPRFSVYGRLFLCLDWISCSFQIALLVKLGAVLGFDNKKYNVKVLRLMEPWDGLATFLMRNPVLIDSRRTLWS